MKVGGLYKLNPCYEHSDGKHLYDIDAFENCNNIDISYLASNVLLRADDVFMVVEVDLFYSHIPAYRHTGFIKILLKNVIYLFPYDIYKPDIFVQI